MGADINIHAEDGDRGQRDEKKGRVESESMLRVT